MSPMVCPSCRLPRVPFGGEDICMGTGDCQDPSEQDREDDERAEREDDEE